MRPLTVLSCLLTVVIALGSTPAARGAERPWNVLFLTADDMNGDSPGWMGDPIKVTPNLDALAATCYRLVSNHVPSAICQPSRQAFMTGLLPQRSGGTSFNPIHEGVPTLVTILKKAGYYTATIDKAAHMKPEACFPWDEKRGSAGKDPATFGERVAGVMAAAKQAGKPFFLNANIGDPHRPWYEVETKKGTKGTSSIEPVTVDQVTALPGFMEDLPAVREEMAQYYSSVKRMDAGLGTAMEALKASGEADRTIVVFLSDHGIAQPFAKTTCFRNGTWSPVILRWPGMGEPQVRQELVMSIDLMPTLLELLKVPAPADLDGRSWLPMLAGQPGGREYVVTCINDNSGGVDNSARCIRTSKRSLIVEIWPDGKLERKVAANSGDTFKAMKETAAKDPKLAGRLKQYMYGTPVAFYDLEKDPDERVNRFADPDYQFEVNQLGVQLIAELDRTKDPEASNVKTMLAGGQPTRRVTPENEAKKGDPKDD